MAYIREKTEELTGYQERAPFNPDIDFGNDFVMIYGIDDSMPGRVREFIEKGYVAQLMTGIAWGEYQDYLNGEWDGRKHWDEGQVERSGKDVLHGPTVPYMCPTISFADYITEHLKVAVDNGVVAIHVEEPEFWDRAGYSEAFKREYEIYYREPWTPKHESLDAQYKTAKLKAYLYCRTIERVSSALKEYAKVKYNRDLRFYVPTHSLLNYTVWKIMSPEAQLLNIPTLDGYIAQIWTGTSREANVYAGVYRERTFETAYLEYGVMQELVKGTDRRMWFLNDPIEDRPSYTWENYRYNYEKTAVASLLAPNIWTYEICPWPNRVMNGKYPKPNVKNETIPTPDNLYAIKNQAMEEQKPIPESYRTFLNSMFQLFGDMEQPDYHFEGVQENVGVFMSDTGLFQRTFPDGIVNGKTLGDRMARVNRRNTEAAGPKEEASRELMKEIDGDPSLMFDFIQSSAFPQFYGLALPLLKYGLPVKPVQLDNIRRFAGYLDDLKYAILSYEFIKPDTPDINATIASWVNLGGTLIYVGDGSDPFFGISSWWRKAGYENPAQHLFHLCGLETELADGSYAVGKGRLVVINELPARICLTAEYAEKYRDRIRSVLAMDGLEWNYANHLTLHRGPYIFSSVMDESISEEPKVFEGLFADLKTDDYSVITSTEIRPDENAMLFDFSKIEGESFRIIGTSARVFSADVADSGFEMKLKSANKVNVFVRVRLPKAVKNLSAAKADGTPVEISFVNDAPSATTLISYLSDSDEILVKGTF